MLNLLRKKSNFERGKDFYKKNQYKKAVKCFLKSLTNEKSNLEDIYFYIGMSYLGDNNYELALKFLKSSLKIQKNAKVSFNIALIYEIQQQYKKSLIYYKIASSIEDNYVYRNKCEDILNLVKI